MDCTEKGKHDRHGTVARQIADGGNQRPGGIVRVVAQTGAQVHGHVGHLGGEGHLQEDGEDEGADEGSGQVELIAAVQLKDVQQTEVEELRRQGDAEEEVGDARVQVGPAAERAEEVSVGNAAEELSVLRLHLRLQVDADGAGLNGDGIQSHSIHYRLKGGSEGVKVKVDGGSQSAGRLQQDGHHQRWPAVEDHRAGEVVAEGVVAGQRSQQQCRRQADEGVQPERDGVLLQFGGDEGQKA